MRFKHKLAVVTFLFDQPWLWKKKRYERYRSTHVNALWRACAAKITMPHRFVCYADHFEEIECEVRPQLGPVGMVDPRYGVITGCFHRLMLYDPEIARSLDAEFILILDLDVVLMRPEVTGVIERAMRHDFSALVGSKWRDGSPVTWYNGSFQLCRAGSRPRFWRDFNPETFHAQRAAYKMPGGRHPHGTDQSWITICAGPGENALGPAEGFYQYRDLGVRVPDSANIIFFSGKVNPWHAVVSNKTPAVSREWWRHA